MTIKPTPYKRITGLGASGGGTGHFIKQRVTALVLLVLVPLFLLQFLSSFTSGYDGVMAWLTTPFGALLTLFMLSAMIAHMRIGLGVVIEDYIGGAARALALMLNTFLCAALWVIALAALIKIYFGG